MVIPSLFTEVAILMIQEMGGTYSLWSNTAARYLLDTLHGTVGKAAPLRPPEDLLIYREG